MKLEARHQTSDILAQIDEALFEVSNLSAKIAFENLFPTCEIGDEIADHYLHSGSVRRYDLSQEEKKKIDERWDSIGRQRTEILGCTSICECHSLPLKDEVLGLSQPFLLSEDEFYEFRQEDLDLPKNDADAVMYSGEFFGWDNPRFEIDYDRSKSLSFNELYFTEEDDDEDHW